MQQVTTKLNNLRIAPRKVALVLDQIRGKRVSQALTILEFQRKAAALPLKKLLLSAVNSWQLKYEEDELNLFITEVYVTQGTSFKRYRFAARGRMAPYKKRGSHITLSLQAYKNTNTTNDDTEAE